jgi:ADP-heptose:LPS heptosyltransferase
MLGLYGAVSPQFRLPPDSPAIGVAHEVPCLFCHHRNPIEHWKANCPYDIRCMTGLEVEPVLRAVEDMLAARGAKQDEAP